MPAGLTPRLRSRSLALALTAGAAAAHAAGGHFDVDDATVLEPGHCQYETWLLRAPHNDASVFHLGPGCRVGPVELGVNLDRFNSAEEHRTAIGPQLKIVADPLVDKLSAGVVWTAAFNAVHGGRPWQIAYVPVTWWVAEKVWLHANVGADWSPERVRTRRLGASVEWAPTEKLTVIAERVTFVGDWISRVGTRFTLNDSISIDVSAARAGPGAARVYAIGLNHDFAR